jgi:hypothetical protein
MHKAPMPNNSPTAHADFETRSACPIRKTGAWKYSVDPSTEILCLAFRLPYWDEGRVSLWHPAFAHLGIEESDNADDMLEFMEWIEAGELVEAHNASFERCIWHNILVPRFGWPVLPIQQIRCSAAKAAAHSLPRSLEGAGEALGLSIRKDLEGAKAMKKAMKPRKSWKKERDLSAKTGIPLPDLLWHESRELFEKVWAYCKVDVLAEGAISDALADLSPNETRMYTMDQTINQRGFQIDRSAVDTALTLIAQETTRLNKELSVVTGGKVKKATQRAQMIEWFGENGLDLPNTQKATIDELLESAVLPDADNMSDLCKRGLEIVRTLGRSSTAKYQAMQNWMDPHDDRVRGGLLYHGASTGRWSGSGVQPHNFVRGSVKDMDGLWEGLKPGRVLVDARGAAVDLMVALSEGLRGAIVAKPGSTLFVADYAAIEARVVMWLADEHEALDIFRSGKDIYCELAAEVYGRPITKADKDERQLGKQGILGCWGADTLVLTQRGWIRIVDVLATDLLWDGVEYVTHDGVIPQGEKETVQWLGKTVTPDHLIWDGAQWSTVAHLGRAENTRSLKSALASVILPLRGFARESGAESSLWKSSAPAEALGALTSTICEKGQAHVAISALNTPQLRLDAESMVTRLLSLTGNTGIVSLIELAQSTGGVRTLTPRSMKTMVDAAFAFTGRTAARVGKTFLSTLSHWMAGTNRTWKSTESITTATMPPATSASLPAAPTCSTHAKVFDLANCGPRNRYTVLTAMGPVLAHNCGFGMGASKFHGTCEKYGIIITEETAQTVVDSYRRKYWRVKDLWHAQESAAIAAVVSRKAQTEGWVTWSREDPFLFCELPSGRRLAYPFPEVRQHATPWGEMRPQLTFMSVNAYTRKWTRGHTYGGSIVENITQAVARDVMAEAMVRCENHGYPIVLSVHDELIAESATGSIGEFERLVAEVPDWCDGLPIAVEGFETTRYRK